VKYGAQAILQMNAQYECVEPMKDSFSRPYQVPQIPEIYNWCTTLARFELILERIVTKLATSHSWPHSVAQEDG